MKEPFCNEQTSNYAFQSLPMFKIGFLLGDKEELGLAWSPTNVHNNLVSLIELIRTGTSEYPDLGPLPQTRQEIQKS